MSVSRPKILISSCILGQNVRYDGGNKLDLWINSKMAKYFELEGVCPEVLMGLGIPREPVNLIFDSEKTRMYGSKSKTDHTESALKVSAEIIANNLSGICGAILQKKSPSCGVERVKLYNPKGDELYTMKKTQFNRGLFANALIEARPLLPVIDSGRFFDHDERENFLRRVVCFDRFMKLDGSVKMLQDFHARYKFVIMEHSQDKMRKLGNLAANSKKIESSMLYREYAELLFETLKIIPNSKSRTNVFYHLIGFFKDQLPASEKMVIHQMIEDYNKKILPYIVPVKMLEYLINKHQQYYLLNHYFLDQFPKELREIN